MPEPIKLPYPYIDGLTPEQQRQIYQDFQALVTQTGGGGDLTGIYITVDKYGNGADYTSIKAAVDAVPTSSTARIVVAPYGSSDPYDDTGRGAVQCASKNIWISTAVTSPSSGRDFSTVWAFDQWEIGPGNIGLFGISAVAAGPNYIIDYAGGGGYRIFLDKSALSAPSLDLAPAGGSIYLSAADSYVQAYTLYHASLSLYAEDSTIRAAEGLVSALIFSVQNTNVTLASDSYSASSSMSAVVLQMVGGSLGVCQYDATPASVGSPFYAPVLQGVALTALDPLTDPLAIAGPGSGGGTVDITATSVPIKIQSLNQSIVLVTDSNPGYADFDVEDCTDCIIEVTHDVINLDATSDDNTLVLPQNTTLNDSGSNNVRLGAGGGASPLTTKGDLYTFDTADARLPVGSNGQMLTADSGEATGLKWVAQPTSLPPSGTAGGDLSGTYPNPAVVNDSHDHTATTLPATIVYDGDAAGGDLSGTYPNPDVVALQGVGIDSAAPSLNDVLTFDGTNWAPAPSAPGSGDTIPDNFLLGGM